MTTMMHSTATPSFASIRDKVRAQVPLSHDDGVALFRHPNLM